MTRPFDHPATTLRHRGVVLANYSVTARGHRRDVARAGDDRLHGRRRDRLECRPGADDCHDRDDDAPPGNGELPAGDDVVVGTIMDGDTLRTTDQERIRLLNIDTPEVTSNECGSAEATEALRALVPPGTDIRLVYDKERTDRYGRTLAHIYRQADALWINLELVEEGVARPYVLQPNDTQYAPIEAAAEEARARADSACGARASERTTACPRRPPGRRGADQPTRRARVASRLSRPCASRPRRPTSTAPTSRPGASRCSRPIPTASTVAATASAARTAEPPTPTGHRRGRP